jgi:hypothetical protein
MTAPTHPPALSPAEATERLNRIARGPFEFNWTDAVKAKLKERCLVVGDIAYICRNGKVIGPTGDQPTSVGHYKYIVACRTPNGNKKVVRLAVCFSSANAIKVFDVL